MYYIVNQTNHIIAADSALLELLSVKDIGELHRSIALNTIEFNASTDTDLDITTADGSTSYAIESHTLSSVLGDMRLIEIGEEKKDFVNKEIEDLVSLDDEISIIDEPIIFDDGVDKLIEEIHEEQENEVPVEEDNKPFDLISDEEPFIAEEPAEETSTEEAPEETSEEDTPIVIDIAEISQKIGISSDDYNNFLNEYIDTALTLEEDLKSTEDLKRSHAVSTLTHLSNVLHLPVIKEIMDNVEKSDENEQNEYIQSFYNTLARLTTSTPLAAEESTEPKTEEKVETEVSGESFGTIDLSDVKPIHFDFQMEEAANDLSLPVELIEEFVIDFLEQAHVETDKMLEAYEKGDLDTIQKIGHLLKGTSSNLRINPLADTLYKIQFCEDSSQLEDLIKDYWGHFLSFEHQINIISK